MLDRKQTLFLQAWGSVRTGGNPSKKLGDIQAEYARRAEEDRKKARLVVEQRQRAAIAKGRK
jgi:hypothetical protein